MIESKREPNAPPQRISHVKGYVVLLDFPHIHDRHDRLNLMVFAKGQPKQSRRVLD
jgi:hypothetical protein